MSMNMAKRAAAGAMKISAWSEDETDAPLHATDHIPISWRNKQRGSNRTNALTRNPAWVFAMALLYSSHSASFLTPFTSISGRSSRQCAIWVKHPSRTSTNKPASGLLRLNARGQRRPASRHAAAVIAPASRHCALLPRQIVSPLTRGGT